MTTWRNVSGTQKSPHRRDAECAENNHGRLTRDPSGLKPLRTTAAGSRFAHARKAPSHPIVIRPAAAFGWNPGDDLVGVHDVAGFAVHAVRGIQADALA